MNKSNSYLSKKFFLNLIVIFTLINSTFAQTGKNADLIYETERLLSERGYWITKVDKTKDASTYHALVAFQKVEGRKRTGILTVQELEAIRAASRPKAFFSGAAHIEVDLARQVLFLVNASGVVTHILPVSTGSGETYFENGKKQIAYTPRGVFKITRQIKGTRRAPLGLLYDPNYFSGGVAIHGSNSIPFYPASHGCVRIPRFASKEFSNLVSVGMKVYVFDKAGQISLDENTEIKETDAQTIPCAAENEKGK